MEQLFKILASEDQQDKVVKTILCWMNTARNIITLWLYVYVSLLIPYLIIIMKLYIHKGKKETNIGMYIQISNIIQNKQKQKCLYKYHRETRVVWAKSEVDPSKTN